MKSQDLKLYPKVLVAIPTYEGKDYAFAENLQCVKSFNYPNYDYVYIDNSSSLNYYLKLRRRGISPKNIVRVPRGPNSRQALCNAQNYARNKVLNEGYDYLMFVESDLFPKEDTIWRMLNHAEPVVGSLYFIGFDDQKIPCIFFKDLKDSGLMGTRLIYPQDVQKFIGSGLQRVHGCGLGCTLIHKSVIERFGFWYDERFDNKHSDVYFYMDLDNNNVPVYVDTDVIVKHQPSQWGLVLDK